MFRYQNIEKRIDVFMQNFSMRSGSLKLPYLIRDAQDTFDISAANYMESPES